MFQDLITVKHGRYVFQRVFGAGSVGDAEEQVAFPTLLPPIRCRAGS